MTEKAPDLHSIPSAPVGETPLSPIDPTPLAPAANPLPVDPHPLAPLPAGSPHGDAALDALRHHARAVSAAWDVAHKPAGPESFNRRTAAVRTTYDQVFEELDRRPMPTYKPGEPLDPLLELRENPRLLRTVLVEMESIRKRLARMPHVIRQREGDEPRIVTVADAYLQASDSHWENSRVSAFLQAVQEADPLTLRELWAFPTAIKFLLVEEILTQARTVIDDPASHTPAGAALLKTRFQSIRDATYANWPQMIEPLVVFDAVLRKDPSGAYPAMDFESRENYRERVAEISRSSDCSELEVAEDALKLALRPQEPHTPERIAARRSHIGYYLLDKGFPGLARAVSYRPPFIDRIRMMVANNPDDFYLGGILSLTVLLIGLIVLPLAPAYSILGSLGFAFLLLLIPAMQGAADFVNNTVTALFKPRALPKLEFPHGLPPELSTLVAVPTLLINEKQVRELFEDLEVRCLANQDRNIHFALLTDLPDSVTRPRANDTDPLVDLAISLVNSLNERHCRRQDSGCFLLLHRHRVFNARQGVWMGWERKRGKLLDLNKLLQGAYDSFPVKAGPVEKLQGVRYVITLDSDTQLPRGAAHAMVGAMAHPLNRAVIDPRTRIVTEGYGILQPRVGVSVHSASRSRLAALYSGQTGFDIYTRAISDVYQDLYGEGIFTGKGIYEVAALHAVLDRRFPRNSLLSHDLIEGAYARAGLLTDVEVIDDYPSHYSAYRRRQHRWVRGDWQITQWLFGRVPDESGTMVRNPISTISRWKIFDNLRRSLVDPLTLILLVAGWLGLPGGALYWTLVTLFLMFAPTLVSLAFSLGRAAASPQKGEWREALVGFGQNFFIALLNLVFLPHQTLLSFDAIIRSLVRRFITGQRLLEWETAAQAEASAGRVTAVDRYLKFTLPFALVIGAIVAATHLRALWVALPILVLWACETAITLWLNHPPREQHHRLTDPQRAFLREMALRTWRFFYQFGGPEHNYLIPDNVEEDALFEAARVSPTNFGLLLNARQAAHSFGYLTAPEFAALSRASLDTYARLEKRRGHIFNWYDTRTLAPLRPITISSVDSGNLAASFYTLHAGAQAMLREPLFGPQLWSGIRDHIALLATLKAAPAGLPAPPTGAPVEACIAWAFQAFADPAFEPVRSLPLTDKSASEAQWWQAELYRRLEAVCGLIRDFLPWLQPEFAPLRAGTPLGALLKDAAAVRLGAAPALAAEVENRLLRAWPTLAPDSPDVFLAEKLRALLPAARERLSALATEIAHIARDAERCVEEMDFAFLIEPSRGILSIGYMVEQEELHKACYDLLCSEARIAAFITVAKGEASQQSWFKLGRIHTIAYGMPALISWTGTMFEYLMPALWMHAYPDTLVTRTLVNVVAIQRAYAREHGNIPWGVSECGYAQKDDAGHYHYQAFGMPSVALKWDATAGPVISPYSTFLALPFDQDEAMRNLKRMAGMGWVGAYGMYEAADYQESLKNPQLVREWMAHHQGMSLLALLNVLHGNLAQEWFHANPNLKATELLLHEKPIREALLKAEHRESSSRRRKRAA